MDNNCLYNTICILLNADMQVEYNSTNSDALGKLDSIAELDNWISTIQHLDEGIHAKRDHDQETIHSQIAASKKQNTTKQTNTNDNPTNFKCKYAYKLNDEEKALLNVNNGCQGCCQLFVGPGHVCTFKMTPLPFDKAVKIMPAHVEKYKIECNKAQNFLSDTKMIPPTKIATVFSDVSDDDEDYEMMLEGYNDKLYADEYVLPNHIFWTGLLSSQSLPFHPTQMLINHGSPLALISSKLASKLSLPLHNLRTPLKVAGALDSATASVAPKTLLISHYICLTVSSSCK
ncbi:hypothetical protein H0H87_002256 [Tephrocybe sp. NHM501043]|nr:hypothetical protein H0H87_002256 [Tephrocybe sp. NHM501043]